jgi:hypothetical protein
MRRQKASKTNLIAKQLSSPTRPPARLANGFRRRPIQYNPGYSRLLILDAIVVQRRDIAARLFHLENQSWPCVQPVTAVFIAQSERSQSTFGENEFGDEDEE